MEEKFVDAINDMGIINGLVRFNCVGLIGQEKDDPNKFTARPSFQIVMSPQTFVTVQRATTQFYEELKTRGLINPPPEESDIQKSPADNSGVEGDTF